MSVPVQLTHTEGDGEVLTFEGECLSCVLSKAFAPGAPIALKLLLEPTSLALIGKAIRSRRLPDGRFSVQLRLISLRREQREALLRALPG